jgi:hypothetical protein
MILGLVASSPSSLVELIKIDAYFFNGLKEFEGVLERDDIVEM